MVKYSPNHILDNIIGYAHNPREIHKDGDIPIFSLVSITLTHMVLNKQSKVGITLSAFCAEVIIIWICSARSVLACDRDNELWVMNLDIHKNETTTKINFILVCTLNSVKILSVLVYNP